MPTLSLRSNGLDRVMTGFNTFSASVQPVTREATYAALEAAAKVTPGWLGGNSYTVPDGSTSPNGTPRTGVLGASVQLEQDGLSSRITVNAYSKTGYNYAPKVLGYADGSGQGYTAANGRFISNAHWPTLRSAVDAEVAKLVTPGQGLDADLAAAAKEAGL